MGGKYLRIWTRCFFPIEQIPAGIRGIVKHSRPVRNFGMKCQSAKRSLKPDKVPQHRARVGNDASALPAWGSLIPAFLVWSWEGETESVPAAEEPCWFPSLKAGRALIQHPPSTITQHPLVLGEPEVLSEFGQISRIRPKSG